jgi:prepilin-type N-terminal cleavage/methylation domain-containing protein
MHNRGFTLIEVLISLIVAVIGIVAILQLQGVFLSTASDSQQRAMATAVAEKKLEELRGFDSIATTSSSLNSFNDINSGSGAENVTAGSTTYTYSLDWTVTPYKASGAVASMASADFKNVTVNVSWDSGASSLSLSSVIGAINPQISNFIDKSGLGGNRPEVDHTPGVAPDVIAIDVGNGLNKETSKPVPEVEAKNDSTVVKFETVTYRQNDDVLLTKEDFVTVNCQCVLGSTDSGISPYYTSFVNENVGFTTSGGQLVTADTGTVASLAAGRTQSDFCSRCCAIHHDSINPPDGVRYVNDGVASEASGDHLHYVITDSSTTPVTLDIADTGDTYLEACRFKRFDGIYRLVPDWSLNKINVFPDYFLATASAGLSDYQQYVKDRIQDAVFGTTSASLPNADFNIGDGQTQQVISRSIYIDDFSHDANLQNFLNGFASPASLAAGNWLQYIPFYEINTTLLSLWRSSSDAVATVSSENIDTIQDASTDYYGSFSRGVVEGVSGVASGASAAIIAYSKDDNTGLLGNTYAETNPNPNPLAGKNNLIVPATSEAEGSLTVTHGGACVGTCYLSGFILENATTVDIDKTVLTVIATQGSCTLGSQTTGGSGNKVSFSCAGVPVTGNVTITVTSAAGSPPANNTYRVDTDQTVTTGGSSSDTHTETMAGVGVTGVNFYLTVLP